jgi:hypothetical protein
MAFLSTFVFKFGFSFVGCGVRNFVHKHVGVAGCGYGVWWRELVVASPSAMHILVEQNV